MRMHTCSPFFGASHIRALTCLGLLFSLGLSLGCTPIQVWMGWRVRLDKLPIATVSASLSHGPGMVPGEKASMVVSVIQPDGTILRTEGAGQGKVLWEDLQVTASVVSVNAKGIVSLPADPRLSDGRIPHINITVPSHPELRAELDIPLRYDGAFAVDFSGRDGSSGWDGSSGLDGSSGSSGSMDPNNPSPGGDGTDGSSGSDGSNGGPGEDALPVHVQIAFRQGPPPLLEVSVSNAERTERFLVDPKGGSLTIKAEGGAGGSGGRGGRGGRGGSGGSGSPSGRSGSDGMSGHDGWSGPAGRGGSITVTYDPRAKPHLSILKFFNRGGSGDNAPLPELHEEPVPPLW